MNLHWRRRRDIIHAWWQRMPEERYWLDVTDRDGRDGLLAAPRGDGDSSASWAHRLITHIKDGDVVFRYDSTERALVALSIASGQATKRDVSWPLRAGMTASSDAGEIVPSWAIALKASKPLDAGVSLDDIARVQWDLFPRLRAFEDRVGEPLYYPFEMGNQEATRPLPGYVFKLPAVFVHGFPALESAAGRVPRGPVANGATSPAHRAPARQVAVGVR
jgi:hypothetical protein